MSEAIYSVIDQPLAPGPLPLVLSVERGTMRSSGTCSSRPSCKQGWGSSPRGAVSLVVCIGYASFSALGSPRRGGADGGLGTPPGHLWTPAHLTSWSFIEPTSSPLGDVMSGCPVVAARLPPRNRPQDAPAPARPTPCPRSVSMTEVGRRWKDWHTMSKASLKELREVGRIVRACRRKIGCAAQRPCGSRQ